MRIKLEKRQTPSRLMLVATPVASVLLTMLIGVVVFDLIGINGQKAVVDIFLTPLLASYKWQDVAVKAAPLIIIALWTVIFLEIHPFQDGNGRLSRVLTTLLLLKTGYAYVPYSSLESIIEQNKEGYYLALRQTQGTIRTESPNWQPWVKFFFQSLAAQVKRLEKKVEHEKIVLAPLPDLSLKIVELAREHGKITISDVVRITGANRNALKVHFRKLTQLNHLEQHGQGRGVWYSLK